MATTILENNIKNKCIGTLKQCQIKDNRPIIKSIYPHLKSLVKDVLQLRGEWINEGNVISIFYNFLYEATDKIRDGKKLSGSYSEFASEQQLIDSTNQFFNFILSIPKKYDVYIPMVGITNSTYVTEHKSNHGLSIIKSSEKEVLNALSDEYNKERPRLIENTIYIKQTLSGYAGESLEDPLNQEAIRNFKILLFFALTYKCLEIKPFPMGVISYHRYTDFQYIKEITIIHDIPNQEYSCNYPVKLPLPFCNFINALDIFVEFLENLDKEKNGVSKKYFAHVLKMSNNLILNQNKESATIKNAVCWYIDSLISEDNTLALIQTCIGLEAILETTVDAGSSITKTLADRCAYLTCSKIKDRVKTKEKFINLYKIRSKVVHGNTQQLNASEVINLYWARSALTQIILKEIELL